MNKSSDWKIDELRFMPEGQMSALQALGICRKRTGAYQPRQWMCCPIGPESRTQNLTIEI